MRVRNVRELLALWEAFIASGSDLHFSKSEELVRTLKHYGIPTGNYMLTGYCNVGIINKVNKSYEIDKDAITLRNITAASELATARKKDIRAPKIKEMPVVPVAPVVHERKVVHAVITTFSPTAAKQHKENEKKVNYAGKRLSVVDAIHLLESEGFKVFKIRKNYTYKEIPNDLWEALKKLVK